MRLLLVNPAIVSDNLYDGWDLSGADSLSPPLGLLSLIAITRQAGHEAELIDAYAHGFSPTETVRQALAFSPDAIGLTASTNMICSAAIIAAELRKAGFKKTIMLGGPHVTAVPVETLKRFNAFDIAIIGEGEHTLIELLSLLENENADLSTVAGLSIRHGDGIIQTSPREPIADLDTLPLPAWDALTCLTNPYRMSIVGTTSDHSTAIVTSRGCPGRCAFCDTSVFGRGFRAFSANYVLKMIDTLVNDYNIEDLLIYDDNFVTNHKRLRQICEGLIERKSISWSCCARVNMVNPEMLSLMRQAGCWQIEYGIESGSPTILKKMCKEINLDQARQALTWTREAGILTRGNFIFGYLGETEETLEESLRFLLAADLDYFQQTFLTPFPGTEVYQQAADWGTFDADWQTMSNWAINFIPRDLTREQLIAFSKHAFRIFYLRPQPVWTQLRQLNSWSSIRRLVRAGSVFLKTIWR